MARSSRQAVNGRTLAGRAMNTIQQRILVGTYPPGTHLPIEDLADEFEISTMPVREALQRLNDSGLVEYRPHRGARVTTLSIDDALDIYSIRLVVETLAIRRAARHFTAEDEVQASHWLAEYLRHEPEDWHAREAQMEFHFTLYRAARSDRLNHVIEPLFQASERYRLLALNEGAADQRRKHHQDLLDACVAHDEDLAAQRLRESLLRTVRAVERNSTQTKFRLETAELPIYIPVPDDASPASSAAEDSDRPAP